jgi:UDP-glucose 4-epimerase
MKVSLVTGGAGFIGSNLARRLMDRGDKVYVLDDLSTGFERNLPEGATLIRVDASRGDEVDELKLPEKIDTLFHFAAQSSGEASFDDPIRDIEVNFKATYNMIRFAERRGAERFIYASSMSVYGEINGDALVTEEFPCRPQSYYGCNKLASEKLIRVFCRKAQVKPTCLRFFNVYGPGQNMGNMKQGMVSIYMSYLMRDLPVVVKGGLERFRDFIFVDDVVDAVLLCEGTPGTSDGVYNVGTGVGTTVRELLNALLMVFGKARFDEWVTVEGETPGDVTGLAADTTRLRSAIGWSPKVGLQDGLARMKGWVDETRRWW